ncbi:MAG: exo-beta-N-acetylmuramidase NamZ family protein [Ginsengibacter sp.]
MKTLTRLLTGLLPAILLLLTIPAFSQKRIIPGAERMDVYLPLLKGKNVAVFANPTSMVGNTHLVDTLLKRGIKVVRIFGPEHGFRGKADAGEKVGNAIDKETGVEVVSLYGKHNKPTPEDLKGVDVMIYDIQDVGVRFYTYISSFQMYMEAALENGIPLLVLDRPNPNGFYVDGPVLQPKYKSFVGEQPVPIVYGLTIGEYGRMLGGEGWLSPKANEKYQYYLHEAKNSVDTPFHFLVIKCLNYDHNSKYVLPVKPSPNLPDIQSIYLYPSTCFFEGTTLSEGRGTTTPFQVFGDPSLPKNLYSFTPHPMEGAMNSKHYGEVCYGWNLSGTPEQVLEKVNKQIQLKYILEAYRLFPDKEHFFIVPKSGNMENSFFDKLAGNNELWQQIKNGESEKEIRKSWQPALDHYKKIRKKYLLYKDFKD